MTQEKLVRLRYFLAFAELGLLSAVAARFDVNESSVSRTLKAFEKEIGRTLFAQQGRRLALTTEGWEIYSIMKAAVENFDAAYQKISKSDNKISGKIRISTASGFAGSFLLDLLDSFSNHYPDIHFETHIGLGLSALRSYEVDLITMTSFSSDSDDLVILERGLNHYVSVATPEVIEQHGKIDTVQDLKNLRVFAYGGQERSLTRYLYKGSKKKEIVCSDYFTSDSLWAIKSAILKNKGVAVDLPLFFCAEEIKKGQLIPILNGWGKPSAKLYSVLTKTQWRKPRIRIFAEWFSEESKKCYPKPEDVITAP